MVFLSRHVAVLCGINPRIVERVLLVWQASKTRARQGADIETSTSPRALTLRLSDLFALFRAGSVRNRSKLALYKLHRTIEVYCRPVLYVYTYVTFKLFENVSRITHNRSCLSLYNLIGNQIVSFFTLAVSVLYLDLSQLGYEKNFIKNRYLLL